jgi:hypothetical protein
LEFNHQGYELKFIQKKTIKDDSDHLLSYIYKFYSPVTNLNYVLLADCHKHDFFAIKFYPKCYKKTDKKYSLITNKGDLGNVLISCLNVIPILLKEHPVASFGFAGARSIDKKSKTVEPLESNQRYNTYTYIAQRRIGNKTFQHFEYPEISGYMLINRACPLGVEHKEEIIQKMLRETYNELPMP